MKIRFIFRYKFSIEKINLIGRFWLDEMSRQKGEKKGQEKTKKNRTLYWPAIEKLSCLFWGGKKKKKRCRDNYHSSAAQFSGENNVVLSLFQFCFNFW
jgi:hypothetical protein